MRHTGKQTIGHARAEVNTANAAGKQMDARRNARSRHNQAWLVAIVLAVAGGLYLHSQNASSCEDNAGGVLSLRGLYEPPTIAGRLMVRAVPTTQPSTVVFSVDGKEISRTSKAPYDLDLRTGQSSEVSLGSHVLTACAITESGTALSSGPVPFLAVSGIDSTFSPEFSPYVPHRSALAEDFETLLRSTATPGAALGIEEAGARRLVFGMYLNFGIDPSLDAGNDQSDVLTAHRPSGASLPPLHRDSLPLSMWFSQDSVFYHSIPQEWPRAAVPIGYIRSVQFSTAYGGDGIGFGEIIAAPSDPLIEVRSQWYGVKSTLRVFDFRMPVRWSSRLPTQERGDRHLIFVDPTTNTFISSYKTSKNASTGGPDGLYISYPHSLEGAADIGGSVAAGFAELPLLVQPGEATDPNRDIPHAIGGAVARTWAARVYPATARDADVLASVNPCTHHGFTNTGIVPYGGIIQLDPDLALQKLGLSLPARRILRAMQVYGYYVMDFGCADLDIYTALDSEELVPYGGVWGNKHGPGIQSEIQGVIEHSRLFIVPPPIKR